MLLSTLHLLYKMLILNTFLRTCSLLSYSKNHSNYSTQHNEHLQGSEHSANKSISPFISNADHLKARLCLYLTVKLVLTHYAGELLRNSLCLSTYSSFKWWSLRLRLKNQIQRQKTNIHPQKYILCCQN